MSGPTLTTAELLEFWAHSRGLSMGDTAQLRAVFEERDRLSRELTEAREALEDIQAQSCIRDNNEFHVCNCGCVYVRKIARRALAHPKEGGKP